MGVDREFNISGKSAWEKSLQLKGKVYGMCEEHNGRECRIIRWMCSVSEGKGTKFRSEGQNRD